MNSADAPSILDNSGDRRGFQPTESKSSASLLSSELLQFCANITGPDLDLPLFDEKRIARDEFPLNHSDDTKKAVRYKLMQPLIFRGKGEVTGRMSVGDEMVFAFDSKEKLNWVRITPYDDPQKIYQFRVTDGQVTISQYNRKDKTVNLGIKPEDLDSVIVGKISNFNKLLATRVKYCRWKKNLLSRITVDNRSVRNILTAVTVITGLTAIALSGDLLANHMLQTAVASDNTRNPPITLPSDNPSLQSTPTPPAGYDISPQPTTAPGGEFSSSYYREKNPDGTILFSKNVDFITDETLVGPYITPKMIIIHWDANEDPDKSTWLATTTRNGLVGGGNSATFAVGKDGVLQLVKMTETQVQSTTSSTGRNDVAINIEIAGSWFDETPPSEAVIEYSADLIARLLLTYPNLTIDDVRGHYQEDTTKEAPDPEIKEYHSAVPVENPDGFEWHAPVQGVYDWGKPDPGENFLVDLKERVQKRIDELRGITGSTAPPVRTRAFNQFPSTESTLFLPPHITSRRNPQTGSPQQVADTQLAAMQNSPRARQQAKESEEALLRRALKQARVNFPRAKGGRAG